MGAQQSNVVETNNGGSEHNYISFFVNQREYNVNLDGDDPELGPNYMLVDYIRDKIGLTGTKCMCRSGGCGVCTVMVKSSTHPKTGQQLIRSINSCLLALYSCDGLEITTIEGLGDSQNGYNPIQDRLVKFGGTQCGFCSPGFVMNMYSYALVNPRFTGGNVEYSLDGNLCRCTGYRPIMDAFKSLASDASEELLRKCQDIEDCYKCPLPVINTERTNDGDNDPGKLEIINVPRNLRVKGRLFADEWIKVTNLQTLFEILDRLTHDEKRYRLVAGNTGRGVYSEDGSYSAYIDINDIPDLPEISWTKSEMTLGGGTTMTSAIDQFMAVPKEDGFIYAAEFAKHFRRLASLTVRNSATLAGNLMLKHDHPEFPSDVFVLFESVGGTVRIGSSPTLTQDYRMADFLNLDMSGKVILSIHLPTFTQNYIFRCFKIAKRYQNSHAYVNAGILFEIKRNRGTVTVASKPSICYGGISPVFVHASNTEQYLAGKQLNTIVLLEALTILQHEAASDSRPTSASPEYRTALAQSLLYKFILGFMPDSVTPFYRAGADDVGRGLNTGTQTFDSDKSKWPLYQPVPKVESYPQVSGEAEFINDMPVSRKELFGVFVLSRVANAWIANIDATQALLIPDVVAFITAKDIPGVNNYAVFGSYQEEIFASNRIHYHGQSIGLIVAKNRHAAFEARKKVVINYKNIKQPLIDIKDAVEKQISSGEMIEANLAFPCRGITAEDAKQYSENMKIKTSQKETFEEAFVQGMQKIKGEFITRGQYHFHLETQTCICIPREDGMDVYSSTQSMDNVQAAVALALGKPNNSINLFVRRIGGGFGAKGTKANLIAAACSVAAYKTKQPVRVVLDLETNMRMIGKRQPYLTKYEATVDDAGKIHSLNAKLFCDVGSIANEPSSLFAAICFQSCYRAENWIVTPGIAVTDTAPNTFCRSPGSAQGIAAIENIMEHIAHTVQKDSLEIRQINYISKGDSLIGIPGAKLTTENPLPGIVKELMSTSGYLSRKEFVENYNKANRWRKRGLSIVPQRIPIHYADFRLPTFISVSHVDGTVSVSHGGIEMGQGINTKVSQVVAYTFHIPLESVKVKPANNLISPNTAFTAASITSELVCHSAKKACLLLLEKMEPIQQELGNPSWQELVAVCNSKGILLSAQYQDLGEDLISYDVWGAALTEVEVDVLTGDYRIIRADIMEDAGNSISPLIDAGQIEGAFVMGLGWLLTEDLVYHKDSGELLTDNTWNYKPMLPADIPEDLRITLLQNTPNPFGVLSSKATAEPPLNMAVSVMFAIRQAIDSARRDAGNFDWYQMDAPVSREDIHRLALTSSDQFIL